MTVSPIDGSDMGIEGMMWIMVVYGIMIIVVSLLSYWGIIPPFKEGGV